MDPIRFGEVFLTLLLVNVLCSFNWILVYALFYYGVGILRAFLELRLTCILNLVKSRVSFRDFCCFIRIWICLLPPTL